jgi:hypothetical protein
VLEERFGPVPCEGMVTTTHSPSGKMGVAAGVVMSSLLPMLFLQSPS